MINKLKQVLGFRNNLEDPNYPLSFDSTYTHGGGDGNTKAGVTVSHKTALAYPPLWRAINLISGDVAKIPVDLYMRHEDGIILNLRNLCLVNR